MIARTRPVLLAALALAASCSTGGALLEQSAAHLETGNVFLAHQVLTEAREKGYVPEAVEKEYWRVRLLFLIWQGKQRVFDERESEGLEFFHQALALDSENRQAKLWIRKARAKMAVTATRNADRLRLLGQLEEAMEEYVKALEFIPGYKDAIAGEKKLRKHFDKRRLKAARYYRSGTQFYSDQRFDESLHDALVASGNNPAHLGSATLETLSKDKLAFDRFEAAKVMEEHGDFGAALMSFMRIRDLFPGYQGVQEHVDLMRREVDAEMVLFRAAMEIARAHGSRMRDVDVEGHLDKADRLLEEAYEMSILQRPRISEIMIDSRQRRFGHRYETAKDLELQGRHERALVLYGEIDKEWKDGFRDVKTRIGGLEEAIRSAKEAFQAGVAAEKKGDAKAALGHYREAVMYCRNYQGLDAKILELSSR